MEILFWCILSHFFMGFVWAQCEAFARTHSCWSCQCFVSGLGHTESLQLFHAGRLRKRVLGTIERTQRAPCTINVMLVEAADAQQNGVCAIATLRTSKHHIFSSDLVPPSRKQGIISEGRMLWGDRTLLRDLCERTFLDMAMGSSERLEWIDILLT